MVVLMGVAIAALVVMEVWWFSEATFPPKVETALDINTATVSELSALSGVDESTAHHIVDGRPYRGKEQLVRDSIIPKATYDEIKEQIVAKQK